MISWRGVAKKRRAQEVAGIAVKSSVSVATAQQSWRAGNSAAPLPEFQTLDGSNFGITIQSRFKLEYRDHPPGGFSNITDLGGS
jgi:hypothetical protein